MHNVKWLSRKPQLGPPQLLCLCPESATILEVLPAP